MMIVAMSGQSINCRLNVVLCKYMEVQETFMCGFLCWWVAWKLWVLMVVWGIKFGCHLWVFWWLEAKIWKLCLELLWRSQMRTLIISLKRQFLCGKMELSTGSYMLTLHVICLLQVTVLFVFRLSFPIMKMSISLEVICVVVLTGLRKMFASSLDSYTVQRPHPWPQDRGSLTRFNSFQEYFRFLSTQIHPLRSTTPIFFCKIK